MSVRERFDEALERMLVDAARQRQGLPPLWFRALFYALLAAALAVLCAAVVIVEVGSPW